MSEQDGFGIDRFECTSAEAGSLSTESLKAGAEFDTASTAECLVNSKRTRHTVRLGARVAMCLIGSLVLLLGMIVSPASSSAQVAVGISVSFGPPALPIYAQPLCPAPGYVWTPGYWAWDPAYGYYWVPGTWVPAPFVGALWTPGYWAFRSGRYFWYAGYWGPVVGYYGGINYGYGYTGYGYHGGYWRHNRFYYNRAVNNIRITNIRYYYNRRLQNVRVTRISYNGGPGGINVRPTAAQLAAARRQRFGPVRQQEHQRQFARNDPRQRATFNRGRPDVAATARPGEFRGNHVVRATRAGGAYREPPREIRNNHNATRRAPARTERGRAFNAPRRVEPRARRERFTPRENNRERQVNRGNPARVERPRPSSNRAYRSEARQQAGRGAEEKSARSSHPENHRGGNGKGNGNGHEH